MKRVIVFTLTILAALAFPVFAFADVAGVGTIIVFGLLPYILIASVIVTAIVVLIVTLRRRKAAEQQNGKKQGKERK